MTHNVESELRRSMDAIHFSGDDKERMVALLMSAEAPRQRRSGKKLLLLALAATLVVGALTGAAVFTRWSRSAQTAYNPPQQVKEQAEKSGLSVMLEDKQKEVAPGEVLSATDQGITITAVQSIVDSYGARLSSAWRASPCRKTVIPIFSGTALPSAAIRISPALKAVDSSMAPRAMRPGNGSTPPTASPSNSGTTNISPPFTNGWPMTEVWSIR